MHIVSLSPSSMDSFQGCHNKFFIEQVLKWRSGNIKAGVKGTICHHIFELLSNLSNNIDAGDNEYYDDELNFTISNLDIDNIDRITSLVFDFYQKQEPLFNWTEADKKECIKWVRTVINSKYDPLKLKIFDIERFFEIELCEPAFCYSYKDYDGNENTGFLKLRGVIDLIIRHDDSTIEVLDWKTGQRKDFHTQKVKEIDDLYDDTQLLVYLYAVKKLYNFPNILVTIFYLREGPFTLFFDDRHVARAKEKILEKFEKIKATTQINRDISWKCGKLCDFNKRTFEGTHIKPFVEFRDGEFTKPGELMSICQQTNYCLEQKGLDWTSKYLKKK